MPHTEGGEREGDRKIHKGQICQRTVQKIVRDSIKGLSDNTPQANDDNSNNLSSPIGAESRRPEQNKSNKRKEITLVAA